MIKVLMVDDNKISLEYFSGLIDWNDCGFELVATASDGKEALRYFKKYMPELVITDVNMPVMDGIELTRKILELARQTIVIFLSGFSDFSYARAALNLRVFDYLLKQETNKSVLADKLKAVKSYLELVKKHSKYFAERELNSLLTEDTDDEAVSAAVFPGTYDLYIVKQDHFLPVFSQSLGFSTQPVRSADLKETCYNALSQVIAVERTDEFHHAVLLRSEGSAIDLAHSLKAKLLDSTGQSFSVIIAGENLNISKINEKYKSYRDSYFNQYFFPVSLVLQENFLDADTSRRATIDIGILRRLISDDDPSEISSYLNKYILSCLINKDYETFNELTGLLINNLKMHNDRTVDYKTGLNFDPFDEKYRIMWYDAFSAAQWLGERYARLSDIVSGSKHSKNTGLMDGAVAYINKNYSDSTLNLQKIAAALKVSVGKLNAVFKQETDDTVWKYIVKIRMAKAVTLLEEGKHTITEICTMVGYNTLSYFSKVFKSEYGASPMDYRRKR